MKMKLGLCLALAAAFAAAPLGSAWAADAKGAKDAKETKETKEEKDAKGAKEAKADEEKTGPTEAEMAKARKLKRPFYMKPVEALKAAEACGQPLVIFFLIEDVNPKFPVSQFIEKKLMSMKPFKDDFAKKNLVLLKLKAKRDGRDEPKFDGSSNYPAVVVVDPTGTRKLFRMPNYDKDGGFGVWLTTVVDMLRTAQVEPEVSKAIEKILENPTEPKKWK